MTDDKKMKKVSKKACELLNARRIFFFLFIFLMKGDIEIAYLITL